MYRDFSIFNRLIQFFFAAVSVFALAFRLAMLREVHIGIGIRIGIGRRCCDVEKHTRHLAQISFDGEVLACIGTTLGQRDALPVRGRAATCRLHSRAWVHWPVRLQ